MIKIKRTRFEILVSLFPILVILSFVCFLYNTVSADRTLFPSIDIKISSPHAAEQIPVGGITIFGTSTDNATRDCEVSVILNNIRPYNKAMATGPGGENDYSTWFFMYYSNDFGFIKDGQNQITAKLSCYFAPFSLTKYYSINVTGIDLGTPSKDYAVSIKEKDPTKVYGKLTISSGLNNTKSITKNLERDQDNSSALILPMPSLKANGISSVNSMKDNNSRVKVDTDKKIDSNKITYEGLLSSHSKLPLTVNSITNITNKLDGVDKTFSSASNNSTVAAIATQTQYHNNGKVNNSSSSATPSSSTTPSNNTYNLKIDNTTIPIKYQISGNGNKLNSFTAQKDNATLLASISSQTDGKLTVELPRSVMDSKKQGNKDDDYAVFEDGQDASADEVKNNDQVRTLAINFDKGSQEISIIGTQIVPEFGNITIVTIVLAIIIITIVVTSAKYNKGLSGFTQRRSDNE